MSHCGEGLPSWVLGGLSGLILRPKSCSLEMVLRCGFPPGVPSMDFAVWRAGSAETHHGKGQGCALDTGGLVCKPLATESPVSISVT